MNKCLNCGKEVKNKYCNASCQNKVETIKRFGEIKNFKVKCNKCEKEFEVTEREKLFPQKEKYYCSRSCANSHNRTEESKLKTSNSIKKLIENGNAPGFLSNDFKLYSPKVFERITKVCPICNNEFIVRFCENDKIYCSKKCYTNDINFSFRKKTSGGMRIGSGRGKSGWYKGYWSDSSWELAWIIYNIDHNIIFERNKKSFSYTFNNVGYKFYPDFICNNEYFEIKGYIDGKNRCKISQFSEKLTIIDKKTIQPYIKYVVEKYGKNYIELYENNPHKIKNNKCLICGEECVNMYCSRICSGKGVRLLKN
jgi:hypothetical protein